ncbi:ribonuclease E/G [Commensalibacter sp. M0402]|uniref:ribonuclease E/G n=1 Tax=Commensalibacter TaxID=1079922 RepID=UPI0018DD0AAC|nr:MULTISPECIES: ribonuclease E/G [Commensalibacter]MBI0083780.1 ribonuclease E/G [Commensalibacter sp. W6292M3]MBI0089016.1 ribonuclease E/G [Commensalibacter melissae]
MPQIWVISAPGLIHIAVTHHDTLLDYALWYPGFPDGFGDIYYGRVTAHLPALGGAFILLGKNISGFLPDNAGAKNLHNGDKIIVKVSRSAQNGKNVRLDTKNLSINIQKSTEIHLIQQGPSPLEDLSRFWENLPIIIDDPHLIHIIPSSLHNRVQIAQTSCPSIISEQIETLMVSSVKLPKGIQASITPTPALVAIDMDSVSHSQENQTKIKAQFDANRIALPPLLHQIKLRNLSGAIFIDLIGLPIKKRRLLQQDINDALANDPLSPRLLGFTHLGLAEIVRMRKRPPLHELLTSDHGKAVKILAKVMLEFNSVNHHYRYHLLKLKLHPHLYQALLKDEYAIKDFERRCSISLQLKADLTFKPQEWDFSYE